MYQGVGLNILVLGGSGFIGSQLLLKLEYSCHNVLSLSRTKPKVELSNVTCVETSLVDALSNDTVLQFYPDVIINLASGNHPRNSTFKEVEDMEFVLTPFFKLLDYYYNRSGHIKVVFSSSFGAIYKSPKLKEVKINSDTNYMATKVAVENYLSAYTLSRKNVSTVILRISNPVGSSEKNDFGIVNVFSKKIISGESIEFVGDFNVSKDYISVEDTVEAIFKSVDADISGYKVLNINSGVYLTAEQMYLSIKELYLNKPSIYEYSIVNSKAFQKEEPYLESIEWKPKKNVFEKIYEIFKSYEGDN